ncbi:hypothetical protein [Candidatus Accumulibacter phosphatis]|uniref:hypothetical protein n=1 Tax=Candidatus Accumulibacter phosphatis TaxID=327160 RepID=UPI0020BF8D09|nr:hypothetical protein [Candidatus Accumulibacter phosphatis]
MHRLGEQRLWIGGVRGPIVGLARRGPSCRRQGEQAGSASGNSPRQPEPRRIPRDVQLVEALYPIRHAAETLGRRIEDSYFATGSEAYVSALLVYQYAKVHNIHTGALEETLDDLGRRFARKTRKSTEAP